MKTKARKEFLFKIPQDLYTRELQKMIDYLRYKKATSNSKATQKGVDKIVDEVRKSRNEKRLASRYL
ncbi:MAG: hypothetical protein JNM88_03030 [Chitinophagaceae bacterium]|nr:hypothetical protein [Chitinophagaceae bacterium]